MNLKLFQESNLISERRLSLITRALSFCLIFTIKLSYMLYVKLLIFQGGYEHV